MILITFILGVVYAVAYITVNGRKGGGSKATVWFLLLTLVFSGVSFFNEWREFDFREDLPISRGPLVLGVGLLSFTLGSFLFDKRYERHKVPSALLELSVDQEKRSYRGLILAAILILIPTWYYFINLGHVPLFQGLSAVSSGGADGIGVLQQQRLAQTSYIYGNEAQLPLKGLFDLLRTVATMYLLCMALYRYRLGEYRRKTSLIIVVLAIMSSLMSGQRWPLTYVVMAVLITFFSLGEVGRRPSTRTLAKYGIIGVGLGLVITVLQGRTNQSIENFSDAIAFGVQNLFDRIFYEQSLASLLSYHTTAYEAAELGGRSYMTSLLAFLPGKSASFQVEFYTRIYGTQDGFTASPDFFTEAYINFGLIGVSLIGFLWAALLVRLDTIQWSKDVFVQGGIRGGFTIMLAATSFTGPSNVIGGVIAAIYTLIAVRIVSGEAKMERRSSTPVLTRRAEPWHIR